MKILVAVVTDKNYDEFAHTTLRWASRAGFNMRVFVPTYWQRHKYKAAVDEANYEYYLSVPHSILVVRQQPMDYARKEGYDLLVTLPDNLIQWSPDAAYDNDKTVIDYAESLGKVRSSFSKNKRKQIHKWPNGARMERVV